MHEKGFANLGADKRRDREEINAKMKMESYNVIDLRDLTTVKRFKAANEMTLRLELKALNERRLNQRTLSTTINKNTDRFTDGRLFWITNSDL